MIESNSVSDRNFPSIFNRPLKLQMETIYWNKPPFNLLDEFNTFEKTKNSNGFVFEFRITWKMYADYVHYWIVPNHRVQRPLDFDLFGFWITGSSNQCLHHRMQVLQRYLLMCSKNIFSFIFFKIYVNA